MKAAGNHARCSCMPATFPQRFATRALTAPEKRNSAAKRKRKPANGQMGEPACPPALVELPAEGKGEGADA